METIRVDTSASEMDRSRAGATEGSLLRASRPFLLLQAAFGSAKLSLRGDLVVHKSLTSKCYSALCAFLCLYIAFALFFYSAELFEINSIVLACLYASYMLITSWFYGTASVMANGTFLSLFKAFSKFDNDTNFKLNKQQEYIKSMNGRVHFSIMCIIVLVSLFVNILYMFNLYMDFKLFKIFVVAIYWVTILALDTDCLMCSLLVEQVTQRLCALRAVVGVGGQLNCRDSLDNLVLAYTTIQTIVGRLNRSFGFAVTLKIISTLCRSTAAAYLLDHLSSGKVPLFDTLHVSLYLLKDVAVLVTLCIMSERLAYQHTQLISDVVEMSIESDFPNSGGRGRARRVLDMLTSWPPTLSLWAGCELRAAFVPVVLSVVTNCILLHLQLPKLA